jgi:UDP-N-acetylmuramate--alanine ligase
VHLIGTGGVGMAGLARLLLTRGIPTSGSELREWPALAGLRALGGTIFMSHDASNLDGVDTVVYSTAIPADHIELETARARGLRILHRSQALAVAMNKRRSIAVAGTHGKTTTTSMIAALLDTAGLDPTVINGGIINAYGSNARLGAGDWMVVEADESDGSFLRLPATIAVVTNIDPEHLDHYGSFDRVRHAYVDFIEKIPFYGFAALCLDHPEVQALIPRVSDRRVVTYGFNPQADVRAVDVRPERGGMSFAVQIADRAADPAARETRRIDNLHLPMLGDHNVQNSLAAVAIAQEMGIDDAVVRRALGGFSGVKRRFTRTGESGGVTVIDDYGHHPIEIAAVLKAARSATDRRVVAVVQPHRYSRLASLFDDFCTCFNDADAVIVSDVYAAGEQPLPGIDRDALIDGLRARGHRGVIPLGNPGDLARIVSEITLSGDMVVCLGAGTVTSWAYALPQQLDDIRNGGAPA